MGGEGGVRGQYPHRPPPACSPAPLLPLTPASSASRSPSAPPPTLPLPQDQCCCLQDCMGVEGGVRGQHPHRPPPACWPAPLLPLTAASSASRSPSAPPSTQPPLQDQSCCHQDCMGGEGGVRGQHPHGPPPACPHRHGTHRNSVIVPLRTPASMAGSIPAGAGCIHQRWPPDPLSAVGGCGGGYG